VSYRHRDLSLGSSLALHLLNHHQEVMLFVLVVG
jgi:hypothetical protein